MRCLLIVAVAVSGCMPLTQPSHFAGADAEPFSHPGLYVGDMANGVVAYRIGPDGTGRSCFRNQYSGRMFYGDIKYDGDRLHTQDGSLTVESANENAITVSTPHHSATLRRAEDAPAMCREFL